MYNRDFDINLWDELENSEKPEETNENQFSDTSSSEVNIEEDKREWQINSWELDLSSLEEESESIEETQQTDSLKTQQEELVEEKSENTFSQDYSIWSFDDTEEDSYDYDSWKTYDDLSIMVDTSNTEETEDLNNTKQADSQASEKEKKDEEIDENAWVTNLISNWIKVNPEESTDENLDEMMQSFKKLKSKKSKKKVLFYILPIWFVLLSGVWYLSIWENDLKEKLWANILASTTQEEKESLEEKDLTISDVRKFFDDMDDEEKIDKSLNFCNALVEDISNELLEDNQVLKLKNWWYLPNEELNQKEDYSLLTDSEIEEIDKELEENYLSWDSGNDLENDFSFENYKQTEKREEQSEEMHSSAEEEFEKLKNDTKKDNEDEIEINEKKAINPNNKNWEYKIVEDVNLRPRAWHMDEVITILREWTYVDIIWVYHINGQAWYQTEIDGEKWWFSWIWVDKPNLYN